MRFWPSADFLQKQLFQKNLSRIPTESKQFGSRSGRHFVGPDMGPNGFQRFSADDKIYPSLTELYLLMI